MCSFPSLPITIATVRSTLAFCRARWNSVSSNCIGLLR
jgi:hypothetical protein